MGSEVEIDKDKLNRLDNFLLFLVSSIGIFYTVITAFVGEIVKIVYILPPLFLGWFMPLYIGYWRGALRFDSLAERFRGWIYFLIGLGWYTIILFETHIPNLPFHINYIIILLLASVFAVAVNNFVKFIISGMKDIFENVTFNSEKAESLANTMGSAMYFGLASALSVITLPLFLPLETMLNLISFEIFATLSILLVYLGYRNEREARNYLK